MIRCLCLTALAVSGCAARSVLYPRDVSSDIKKERPIALQGVLNNLGPDGSLAPGAAAGVLVASPSTVNPNYYYTWTRDSALTFMMLIDEFIFGNANVESNIKDYIKAQAILQTVTNPSGSLSSGRGLGEPKFYVNQTRFTGSWGRPQRDGPALRASALIAYTKTLLEFGDDDEAQATWEVIQNDLNYVGQYWNQTGFDLWEEVLGSSFFTIAVQHRALVEGAAMAKELGRTCEACESQAPQILCFMQSFWNGEYVVANINVNNGRTGIDSNTVLTSITNFDPEAECDDTTFQPCSPRALSNLKVYVDAFRDIYEINSVYNSSAPVATGRYAEDVYYDGNPWYLTTLAVAEQLYDAIYQWKSQESILVTNVDLAFWQQLIPNITTGTYTPGGSDNKDPNGAETNFNHLINTVFTYADGFVDIVNKHIPANGSINEQFNKTTGEATSAIDLTWSFASYVTMSSRRTAAIDLDATIQPASWGSSGANVPPSICQASSVQGNYSAAISAGAPQGSDICYVTVLFNVAAPTIVGENIFIVGNTTDLGNWNLNLALPASASKYQPNAPLWYLELDLPASTTVAYQWVRQESDSSWNYEGVNRTYSVPPCGSAPEEGDAVVNDDWQGPAPSG